jgi:glucose/arabinose dehydrogenase
MLGKILRIDVDTPNGTIVYSSPSTNPFFGQTAGLDEIYAFGMRNPWRFSFDRSTAELLVADVGQSAREEIDIVTIGGNYGWRVMEGTICNPNFNNGVCTPPPGSILPIFDYAHLSDGAQSPEATLIEDCGRPYHSALMFMATTAPRDLATAK